ncbi:MAG: proton-conducting transporter membrane subunit [Planctomycetota bacterium]
MYAELAATVLFTPFVAFVVLLVFGRGPLRKAADYFSIAMMGVALCTSLVLFYNVMTSPEAGHLADNPITYAWDWMRIGRLNLTVGFLIDPLSAFMAVVVTGLATFVLIFSVFYLYGDTMYSKYFMYMNFFCFTMLGIVFSENLFMTFIFWELVGLGSYFLIGFWYYKPPVAQDPHYQELKAAHATGIDEDTLSPAFAQKKAFVMNRIGDLGFISGIAIFFAVMAMVATGTDLAPTPALVNETHAANAQDYVVQAQRALVSPETAGQDHTGILSFKTLYKARALDVFSAVHLQIFGHSFSGIDLLTLATILTFMGAIGKSAQFPLHTWLADAMQGPTTGSSIIHAATMVAAGVYLTARIHPLLTPTSMYFVALIGGLTCFIAATIAVVQWDIKAVLAYSTISQLGYMMLGLGTNGPVESFGYSAGLSHLFTHAFFKCMLFLCAGSVIHACHHNQDMFKMGGLRKKLPLTFTATMFGCFAISGVPLFSGFFSKDAILVGAMYYGRLNGDWYAYVPYALGAFTAILTACYMFRMLLMTFTGTPKDWARFAGVHAQKPWGLGKIADLFGPPPTAPAGVDLHALEVAAHAAHGHDADGSGAHDSHATHDTHGATAAEGTGHDAHGAPVGHGAADSPASRAAAELADFTNRPGPFPYHPPEHDVSYGVRSPAVLGFCEAIPLIVLGLMTFGFWFSGRVGLPFTTVRLPFFSVPASHVGADGKDELTPGVEVSWIDRYIHRPRVEDTLAADRLAKQSDPSLAFTLTSAVDSTARETESSGKTAASAPGPLPFEPVAYAADETGGATLLSGAGQVHSLAYIDQLHEASEQLAGQTIGFGCMVFGLALAFFFYWLWPRKGVNPHKTLTAGPAKGVWVFLANLWFFDAVYDRVFVAGGKAFAAVCGGFDMLVIDKAVDLWGWIAAGLGQVLRWVQTGRVQTYVLLSGLAIVMMVILLNFGDKILAFLR